MQTVKLLFSKTLKSTKNCANIYDGPAKIFGTLVQVSLAVLLVRGQENLTITPDV